MVEKSTDKLLSANVHRREVLTKSRDFALQLFSIGVTSFITSPAWAGVENNWRFCLKCHQMFYNGHEEKGRCPGGSGHQAAGFNFALNFDTAKSFSNHQFDWRVCTKCKTLFFDGYPTKGKCSAGGGHQAAGFMFGLPLRPATWGPLSQGDWRYCNKCQVLFFNGYPSKGKCAAGGEHAAQGYTFFPYYLKTGTITPSPQGSKPSTQGNEVLPVESELILRLHNHYRAKHCVPPLKWSPVLAQAAKRWAELCTPSKDTNTGFAHEVNGPYGENLYTGATVTAGIELFYNESKLYNFDNPVYCTPTT